MDDGLQLVRQYNKYIGEQLCRLPYSLPLFLPNGRTGKLTWMMGYNQ
jgi:hypothetical protein